MKRFKQILALILAVEVCVTIFVSLQIKENRRLRAEQIADLWFNNYSLVAHGLGGIDGKDYTNSLEAFELQYALGTRIFEVDLALTADQKLVLTHGWKEHKTNRLGIENADGSPMNYDEFMSSLIYGSYTPLSSENLIEIMKKYPDIYVVLDWGKDLDWNEKEQKDYIFELDELIKRNQLLINQFKEVDESLLNRVIPQIYYEKHFEELDKIYPFENYIYTLYKNYTNTTAKEVVEFAQKNEINVIVTNLIGDQALITAEVKRLIENDRMTKEEMGVFLHTINNLDDTVKYIEEGYKGVFTDHLNQDLVWDGMKYDEKTDK